MTEETIRDNKQRMNDEVLFSSKMTLDKETFKPYAKDLIPYPYKFTRFLMQVGLIVAYFHFFNEKNIKCASICCFAMIFVNISIILLEKIFLSIFCGKRKDTMLCNIYKDKITVINLSDNVGVEFSKNDILHCRRREDFIEFYLHKIVDDRRYIKTLFFFKCSSNEVERQLIQHLTDNWNIVI